MGKEKDEFLVFDFSFSGRTNDLEVFVSFVKEIVLGRDVDI